MEVTDYLEVNKKKLSVPEENSEENLQIQFLIFQKTRRAENKLKNKTKQNTKISAQEAEK